MLILVNGQSNRTCLCNITRHVCVIGQYASLARAVIAPAGFGPKAKPEEAFLESPRDMTSCSFFGEIIP